MTVPCEGVPKPPGTMLTVWRRLVGRSGSVVAVNTLAATVNAGLAGSVGCRSAMLRESLTAVGGSFTETTLIVTVPKASNTPPLPKLP